MLPPLLEKTIASPRDRWLWAMIGALLVGQVIAFWMLCQSQVSKAEARHASVQVGRVAMADCLQYPKSTLTNCATRVAPQTESGPMSVATPVSYSAVR